MSSMLNNANRIPPNSWKIHTLCKDFFADTMVIFNVVSFLNKYLYLLINLIPDV